MDNITKEQRSAVMSLVKSRDTKPEVLVRKFLHYCGFRFRLHDKNLPGKPDIVLRKYRTVVLIHGCFWHGHKSGRCRLARIPKSNIEFWKKKIIENAMRDQRNKKMLKKLGWHVIEVWECQLRKPILNRLAESIRRNVGSPL